MRDPAPAMDGTYKIRSFGWIDEYDTWEMKRAYYLTEDAGKLDATALRKGEVYVIDDFYERARAWYKTEIDRLLWIQWRRPSLATSRAKPSVESPKNQPEPQTTPITPNIGPAQAPSSQAQTPTRIQPARAAKRKAAEPPSPPKRPPKRRKKAQPSEHSKPDCGTQTPAADAVQVKPDSGPHSDYTLTGFDWDQFLNGNKYAHERSSMPFMRLDGLDASFFSARLKYMVEAKIQKMVLAKWKGTTPWSLATDETPPTTSNKNQAPRPLSNRTPTCPPLQTLPWNHTCALSQTVTGPRAPFVSASVTRPGELWPPPKHRDYTDPEISDILQWAADEGCCWREEPERIKAALVRLERHNVAAEAEMQISPTLGRWGLDCASREDDNEDGAGGEVGLQVEENLGANVVEVSGLRFAVDLCCCKPVLGEGAGARWAARARVLML